MFLLEIPSPIVQGVREKVDTQNTFMTLLDFLDASPGSKKFFAKNAMGLVI
jgi:hypothetical protein